MSRQSKNKVLFICPYPFNVAPSQRLKFEQYYPAFREAGFRLTHSSFVSEAFWKIIYTRRRYGAKFFYTLVGYAKRCVDLFRIPFYDVVYVHLWVTPFGPPIFERLVCLLAKRVVYDIDDMIYLKEQKSKANPVISNLKGKQKPLFLFKNADYVLTSTDAIRQYATAFSNRVVSVPITVDTNLYRPKLSYAIQHRKPIIGWTGSLSTSPYLHLLDGVLKELSKEYEFQLMVMGDPDFSIPGVDVKAIPWRADYEVTTIASFDIGLYPLPDDPWVHGKGGGKALQYMALGVPTVATWIAYNSKIIENGVDGFLVTTDAEWKAAIIQLLQGAGLREEMGKKAAKKVEEKFSINANKEAYLSLLHSSNE